MVNVEVVNVAGSGALNLSQSGFELIGYNPRVYETFLHSCGVIPYETYRAIYSGGKYIQRNVCFKVDADESGFVLIHNPAFSGDGRFLRIEWPSRPVNRSGPLLSIGNQSVDSPVSSSSDDPFNRPALIDLQPMGNPGEIGVRAFGAMSELLFHASEQFAYCCINSRCCAGISERMWACSVLLPTLCAGADSQNAQLVPCIGAPIPVGTAECVGHCWNLQPVQWSGVGHIRGHPATLRREYHPLTTTQWPSIRQYLHRPAAQWGPVRTPGLHPGRWNLPSPVFPVDLRPIRRPDRP